MATIQRVSTHAGECISYWTYSGRAYGRRTVGPTKLSCYHLECCAWSDFCSEIWYYHQIQL